MLTGVWIEEGGRRRVLVSRSGGGIRAAQGRSSWRGRRRAVPVVLVPRIDVRARCEARGEVRRAGDAPAASNRSERAHLWRRSWRKIDGAGACSRG